MFSSLSFGLLLFSSLYDLAHCQTYCGSQALGTSIDLDLTINSSQNIAEITIEGPSNAWFGVGFGGTVMSGTYAIVINSDEGTVTQYKLGATSHGTSITSDCPLSIVSGPTTTDGKLMIGLQRTALLGGDCYNFMGPNSISLIWSFGSSTTWQKHVSQGSSSITFSTSGCDMVEDLIDANLTMPITSDSMTSDDDSSAVNSNLVKINIYLVFSIAIVSVNVLASVVGYY